MLAGGVVLVLIALAALIIYKKKQSRRLQERFGQEYDRSVDDLGSRSKAESELKAREKRVEKFIILPLAPAEAERFSKLDSEFPMFPKELCKYTARQVFGKGGIKVNFLVNYGWRGI
jgi:undecaprenyl pyrophosphate synthase